jgi:hypothetical protein
MSWFLAILCWWQWASRVPKDPVPTFMTMRLDKKLLREVAVYHLAVSSNQTGNPETEFLNGSAHLFHRGIVLARILRVGDQAVDGTNLDLVG